MKIFIGFLVVLLSLSFAQAADTAQNLEALKKKLQRKSDHSMSKRMGRKFRRIHTWMTSEDKKNRDRARQSLKELIDSKRVRPSEKDKALLLLGDIYSMNNNYAKAIPYYEQVLQRTHISYQEYLKYLLILVHRYMALEKDDRAYAYIQKWKALTDKDRPEAYVMLASIDYRNGKKKKSLAGIEKAISMSEAPRKSWLSFAVILYVEFKKYNTAEKTLRRLLTLYPSSQLHWKQMSSVFLSSSRQKTPSALAAYQLAHKARPLEDEGSLTELVRLLLDRGIPHKAAQNWELAIQEEKVKDSSKNYEILGDSWMHAGEKFKALKAYKKAAEKSDKGAIWLKLGVIYLNDGKWQLSINNMNKALLKEPDIENADSIYIRIGYAYYNLNQYQQAFNAYKAAEKLRGDFEMMARRQSRKMKEFL